jgi:hypothetical protein
MSDFYFEPRASGVIRQCFAVGVAQGVACLPA